MTLLVTYHAAGEVIDYTPSSAVDAGAVVVQGELVGVAIQDIAADTLGSLRVAGILNFPKASGVGTAITAGASVYWDVGDSVAQEDDESGANKLIGKVVEAVSDDDTYVFVRMSQ